MTASARTPVLLEATSVGALSAHLRRSPHGQQALDLDHSPEEHRLRNCLSRCASTAASGRADEIMADVVARCLVENLEMGGERHLRPIGGIIQSDRIVD
jgi:hypothetical protein